MKAVIKRLQRLEGKSAGAADLRSHQLADLIRERRRRRLQSAGQALDGLPWTTVAPASGRLLSVAETLRRARQNRWERAQPARGSR
jgi:hypothetical protein